MKSLQRCSIFSKTSIRGETNTYGWNGKAIFQLLSFVKCYPCARAVKESVRTVPNRFCVRIRLLNYCNCPLLPFTEMWSNKLLFSSGYEKLLPGFHSQAVGWFAFFIPFISFCREGCFSPISPEACPLVQSFMCHNRSFILDGHVQLKTGLQTQERHLFLFTDLLVVAKSKWVWHLRHCSYRAAPFLGGA